MLKRFDSYTDFTNACAALPRRYRHSGETEGSWYNNLGFDEALNLARNGDDSAVPQAEKLLDELETIDGGIEVTQWVPSVFGAFPSVPDYLANVPNCMRIVGPTGEVAPINVYVSVVCSAALDADTMLKRGVAILALVLKLQQIRPVELSLLVETDGKGGETLLVIPMDSKPLSLAHAAYCLANVGFARRLTYSMAEHLNGFMGGWPDGYRYGQKDEPYKIKRNKTLELTPDDLMIESAHVMDQLIKRPVDWINDQVRRYNVQAE